MEKEVKLTKEQRNQKIVDLTKEIEQLIIDKKDKASGYRDLIKDRKEIIKELLAEDQE